MASIINNTPYKLNMININNRTAKIIKKYTNDIWRIKFIDNNEIINIFYSKEETFNFL